MIIDIKIIPHKQQRYNTTGDWILSRGLHDDQQYLYIKVSELGDWRMEFLVSIHEQIEAAICMVRGINQMDIDRFDMEYEAQRKHGDTSEPGQSRKAPYYYPHKFATWVERFVAFLLKVDWKEYDKKVNELDYEKTS